MVGGDVFGMGAVGQRGCHGPLKHMGGYGTKGLHCPRGLWSWGQDSVLSVSVDKKPTAGRLLAFQAAAPGRAPEFMKWARHTA